MYINRRQFLSRGAAVASAALVPGFLASCAKSGAALVPSTSPSSLSSNHFSKNFGIDEQILGQVMNRALSSGGEFCDIYLEHTLRDNVRLQDGEVNAANAAIELGVGIRVVSGSRFGYAFTEELTLPSMLKAAETAAAIAKRTPVARPPAFQVTRAPNYYPVEETWDHVGIDRKMPWLSHVNERMMGRDPRVSKAFIFFANESKRVLVATSDGMVVEDYQPMTLLFANCVAEKDGRREQGSFNLAARDGASFFTEARLNQVADESVRRTLQLFEAVSPPAGEWPVVLGPGPSGILLHEAIGHGIEADFNRKNVSIFADKMGKKVAIPEVTVVDSGIHPHERGTINVDDEGSPSEETILVDQGVLRSYMHDRISAAHYNVAPTGSGRRQSFRFPPLPRMRNTYMKNGPHDPEEILRSVKKGIYAEAFRNGQVRIGEGSFSFYIASGFMIEDGKKTAPIKDVNIIGNGPEVLGRITMVANDLAIDLGGWTCGKGGQGVPVSQGLPTTLVSSVTVGGTQG